MQFPLFHDNYPNCAPRMPQDVHPHSPEGPAEDERIRTLFSSMNQGPVRSLTLLLCRM